MDQPIIKEIIRLFAIRISFGRGTNANDPVELLFHYFNNLHHEVSKSTIDAIVSEYTRHMEEPGVTAEQLMDDVLIEIRESLEYKDQLQLFFTMLDLANQSESLEKIIQPLSLAEDFGLSDDDADRFRLFMTAEDPSAVDMTDCLVYSSAQDDKTEKLEGRWIDDRIQDLPDEESFLEVEDLKGKLLVMYLKPIQSFVVRCIDNEELEVDGNRLSDCRFKILGAGSSIHFNGKTILTFSEIKQRYLQQNTRRIISLYY